MPSGSEKWRLDDSSEDFLEQVESVVATVRGSRRPGFLIIDTMRMGPHSKGDDLRDQFEIAAIRDRDPLESLGRRIPEGEREALRQMRERIHRGGMRARDESSAGSSAGGARLDFRSSAAEISKRGRMARTAPANVRSDLNAALRSMLRSFAAT